MSIEGGPSFWGTHVVLIVTGASKGFGKAIVDQFSRSFSEYHATAGKMDHSMKLVLSARDEIALKNLVNQIQTIPGNKITVEQVIGAMEDKSTLEKFKYAFHSLLEGTDQVILIHNAGSLGDSSKLVNEYCSDDTKSLNLYLASNVTSMITITGLFLTTFETIPRKLIVNVSSLAATSPLKGLSIYCIGKAARDAYIRSVASELENIRAINYAPGPLKTAMAEELRVKSHLKEFFEDPTNILDPKDSADKLLTILKKDSFINGAHADYYDDI